MAKDATKKGRKRQSKAAKTGNEDVYENEESDHGLDRNSEEIDSNSSIDELDDKASQEKDESTDENREEHGGHQLRQRVRKQKYTSHGGSRCVKSQRKEPDPPKTKSMYEKIVIVPGVCLVCVSFVLLGIIMYVTLGSSKDEKVDIISDEDPRDFLYKNLGLLKKQFPGQAAHTWNTLQSAPHSHLQPGSDPQHAVVVMLYRETNSSSEKDPLITKIGTLYSAVLSRLPKKSVDRPALLIRGKEMTSMDALSAMREIDSKFKAAFNSGVKVAIVHDFDLLPPCSVLIFHNYCNNDDAPYTKVAIILTVQGDATRQLQAKSQVLEGAVGELLRKNWSACPEDLHDAKIDAMLSRVANNVVLVRDVGGSGSEIW